MLCSLDEPNQQCDSNCQASLDLMEIEMAAEALPSFLVNKLAAIAFLVVGFLVLASGYRYESLFSMIGGALLLLIGIALLVLKIIRRNEPRRLDGRG